MRQVFWVLVLMGISILPALAEGLEITTILKQDKHLVVEQIFDLLIQSMDVWDLELTLQDGYSFIDEKQQAQGTSLVWSGIGFEQAQRSLAVEIETVDWSKSNYQFSVEFVLKGARGVLGVPLPEEYWVLPLNSDDVVLVNSAGEARPLLANTWHRVDAEERVLFGQMELKRFNQEQELKHLTVNTKVPRVSWQPSVLSGDVGQLLPLTLTIEGPSMAGLLLLTPGEFVELKTDWFLNGDLLPSEWDQEGNLLLTLPQLTAGTYKLEGTLQTELPFRATTTKVQASYEKQVAELEVNLARSWFDFDEKQKIQLQSREELTLLLPRGKIQSIQGQTELLVPTSGLNVLLPLENPRQPIWIGTAWSESKIHGLNNIVVQNFCVPILIWDQGFDWRLITKIGSWLLDFGSDFQTINGNIGNAELRLQKGKLSLVHQTPVQVLEDEWYWRETDRIRQGIWSKGAWAFNLELPKEHGEKADFTVGYKGEHWKAYLSPRELSFNYKQETWGVGASLAKEVIWLQTCGDRLTFSLYPQQFNVDYQGIGDWQASLCLGSDKNWHVQLQAKQFELYANNKAGGLRFKQSFQKDHWLALYQFGLEHKNQKTFSAYKQRLGYTIQPWCTIYLEGDLLVTWPPKRNQLIGQVNFGCGLVLTPKPQLIASVHWDQRAGWDFKAGIVIPFVKQK